jgi:hypothetical protein
LRTRRRSRCSRHHGKIFADSHQRLTNRSSQSLTAVLLRGIHFFRPAFLRAAHRAFINWESLFRPAGVSPPFFRVALLTPVPFRFAHRAFAATESLLRVAADILRRPLRVDRLGAELSKIEVRRFSKVPICRRIESASSSDLSDICMQRE